MSKGFTLTELIMTVVVLSVLSAFTFSVIWQYSQIYADTKGGYVYGEAAAVLERITRELRDAKDVDLTPFPSNGSTSQYISFNIQNGTPADMAPPASLVPPYWVQYCLCTATGALYRVATASQPAGSACTTCPPAGSVLMTRSVANSGFQVMYIQNDPTKTDDNSYEITLQLVSRSSPSTPSIKLMTRVSPRNYSLTDWKVGRSFGGKYYDEIN